MTRLLATTAVVVITLGALASPVTAETAKEPAGPGSCVDDTWAATSTFGAPSPRSGLSSPFPAVWTGTEMIIWGGTSGDNSGGRYNPAADTWAPISTDGAPSRRWSHTAIWTGTEMLVWGGQVSSVPFVLTNTGGRYDPATDTWAPISTDGAPSARYSPTAVWTGTEMIVWGGGGLGGYLNTGGRYDPTTDTWSPVSTEGALSARGFHTAVWTGSQMVAWGGLGCSPDGFCNTGGRYDPQTDTWAATSTERVPSGREGHAAVWTGTEMIVWGGGGNHIYFNTGGRYDPATDIWTAMSTSGAPSSRAGPTAVWTDTEMIVWGGSYSDGINLYFLNTGGRYNPSTDTWLATSLDEAPTARGFHTAVWTGTAMIVWGGDYIEQDEEIPLNTGGRYCASAP